MNGSKYTVMGLLDFLLQGQHLPSFPGDPFLALGHAVPLCFSYQLEAELSTLCAVTKTAGNLQLSRKVSPFLVRRCI